MTQVEAKQQVIDQMEMAGVDWNKLLALVPQIMALIQAIIDAMKKPTA